MEMVCLHTDPNFKEYSMSKHCFNASNAPLAIGPYSHAVIAGDFVYLSGQAGLDPSSNQLVSGGIVPESRQVLTNLKAILTEMKLSLADVVKTSVFLKDMADFAAFNAVYAEFFPADCPARTTIQAAALPKNASVEIDLVAYKGK